MEECVQITVKMADHEINGGQRYKSWVHHPERVMERLVGWQLVETGPDFCTFNIPQSIVAAAETERQAKIPREKRRYWGDKTDFARCLEVVYNETKAQVEKAPALPPCDKHLTKNKVESKGKKLRPALNTGMLEVGDVVDAKSKRGRYYVGVITKVTRCQGGRHVPAMLDVTRMPRKLIANTTALTFPEFVDRAGNMCVCSTMKGPWAPSRLSLLT